MRNVILTEIKLRSTDWANVSGRYRNEQGVSITRGKTSPTGNAGPSQATLTLDNTGGTFSPRNPNSDIYGQFGRNTPMRISVVRDESTYGLVTTRGAAARAQAPDAAGISVTGDLDLRVDLELLGPEWSGQDNTRWRWPTAGFDLASKWRFVAGDLSWCWLITGGQLVFRWSTDGSANFTATCSTTLPGPGSGRRVLRVTIDVDNGASGRTVTFYQGPSMTGPWTVLDTVTQAGTTSIFDSPEPLRVGAANENNAFTWGSNGPCVIYAFEMRDGIDGAVVASPDFTTRPLDPVPFGPATFTDTQGNAWSFLGTADGARIWYGKTATRFVGEVAEWPPRWDPSHRNKFVPVTANGILRRLGQGKAPVATGLRDYILQDSLVDALAFYVPLSGAEGTQYSLNIAPRNYYLQTRFYPWSFINNVQPVFKYGVDMGAGWIGTGMELNATSDLAAMIGDPATADQNCALDFVFQSPSLGVLTVQLQDYSGNLWNLVLDTPDNDGTLQVSFDDPNVGPIGFATQGPFSELQDNNLHHLRFQVLKNGSDTDFAVYIDGTLRSSGTMTGYVMNGWARFTLFYTRYVNQTIMNIAHIACWANANAAEIPPIADVVAAAFGYSGETAGERIERVAGSAGIPVQVIGSTETTRMGPQAAESRLDQLRDAEATDMGILTEQREDVGLLYRSRASMYAQTGVTVDYSARLIAPPFEPVDDDALTRNDVTASRRDGGSFQLRLETGPMSVLDPPAGIGQYEDEIRVNLQSDAQLPSAAAWWLNLGTIDAARFDSVTFNLAAREVQDTPGLLDAILSLDVGDRLVIGQLGAADIPDSVDLLIQGYSETVTNTQWQITFTCAPGQPYQVAKFGTARFDHEGSTLAAAVDTTAGSLSLATATGCALWTTDPAAFPLDLNIDGERVTCTGITGASSPQTAAVVRSVNGVVADHAAGATVRLWDRPRFAY